MVNRVITWGAFIFVIIIGIITITLFILNSNTPVPANWGSEAGTRTGFTDWINILFLSIFIPMPACLLGVLIIARQAKHRIGWLLIFLGIIASLNGILAEFNVYTNFTLDQLVVPGQMIIPWFQNWFWVILFAVLLLTLALFPTGKLLSRTWGILFFLFLFIFAVPLIIATAIETPMSSAYAVENPFVSEHNESLYGTLFSIGVPAMPVVIGIVFALVIARYLKGNSIERQQIKWLAAAILVMVFCVLLGLGLVFGLGINNAGILLNISAILPLTAIGLSVLRYRLYDIDLIINRALVYGAVTITLALLYFAGVVLLQQIFRVITGQSSQLVIVISTLMIAALFNPLRRRFQNYIDRRFYRSKYDAEKALSAFSIGLRDAVDVDVIKQRMLALVEENIQPSSISIWMMDGVGELGQITPSFDQKVDGGAFLRDSRNE